MASVWAFALLPTDAHTESSCGEGQRIVVETTQPFNDEAKVADAICEVLRGVLAEGSGPAMPNPLILQLVDEINGSPLNAQYVSPNLFGRAHAHVEVTRDLAKTFSQDGLAVVLGHETAHRLNWNTEVGTLLKTLRVLFSWLAGCLVGWLVLRSSELANGWRRALPIAAGISATVLTALAMTVAIAGASTYFEYSADAAGLRLLRSAGWSPARARSAFTGFINSNGGRSADSWLASDRHPSDADREQAIDRALPTPPRVGPSISP